MLKNSILGFPLASLVQSVSICSFIFPLFSSSLLFLLFIFSTEIRDCSNREEEDDRAIAAAVRASMVTHRQEERVQERSAPKHSREDRAERADVEDPRHRTGNIKPINKPPGEKKRKSH